MTLFVFQKSICKFQWLWWCLLEQSVAIAIYLSFSIYSYMFFVNDNFQCRSFCFCVEITICMSSPASTHLLKLRFRIWFSSSLRRLWETVDVLYGGDVLYWRERKRELFSIKNFKREQHGCFMTIKHQPLAIHLLQLTFKKLLKSKSVTIFHKKHLGPSI